MTSSPAPGPAVPSRPASRRPPGGSGATITPEELEVRLRGPGELTEADLDALEEWYRLYDDPDGDDAGYGPGAGCGPDAVEGGLAGCRAQPDAPDIIEAGFVHRYPADGATGFRAGGPLDRMLPGAGLAWHAGNARKRGLGALTDDELIGVLAASRRVQSWQAELELAAAAELDGRRAGPDGREGEHVDDELAAALTLTGRGAQALLDLSRQLDRLPCTAGLLAAGVIDRQRAAVIASHLSLLPDDQAAAVDAAICEKAGEQTTGQLGQACRRKVLAHDPDAYERRKEQARKNARVECWDEPSGTAAIAGRDMDRSVVICGDKNLDADARWLAAHGLDASHDELRAIALGARLTSQPLSAFLPAGPDTRALGGSAGCSAFPDAPAPGGAPGWINGINLTMPITAWLGMTSRPGDISGTGAAGPADAATCRQLTVMLARRSSTRWCITLTDPAGHAVAHGCARAGPGPPGADKHAWLAAVKVTPIETGTCAHADQSLGYRPSPKLRHKVKVRSPRCGFPGCRRTAWHCDDDHTVPYHKGGRTCECNLHPLCRYHHRAKQSAGWHLEQPEPGVLIWTTPAGRKYTVRPEPYPV